MHHCRAVPTKFEAHANAFTVAVFNYHIIELSYYHISEKPPSQWITEPVI